MNEETSPEDLTILAALATLEPMDETPGGTPEPRPVHVSDTSEMLARLYREVLGLLPLELEPIAPAPAVKARMMAKIRGDETQPAVIPPPVTAPAPPIPARPAPPAAPIAPRAPVAAPPAVPSAPTPPLPRPAPMQAPPMPPNPPMPAPSQAAVPPQPAAPRTQTQEMPFWRPTSARSASAPRRPNRWPLALAATLAFLALGAAGWMFYQMQRGQQTIAALHQQLEAQRTVRAGDELDNREKLGLVTSPSVLVAALRPDGQAPSQPYAHGMLFVGADHQHWYLALQGLRPAGSGQAYKLWFVADQGMVDAGSFTIDPKLPIELSSKQMPAGTRAAIITLENDPHAPAPTGPPVLRAGPMVPMAPITT
jgi:hypothetical protein